MELPCGRCVGCRLERSRQWAVRCVHEASQHQRNCFLTLTYREEDLAGPSLVYRDFQLFMKRLRRFASREAPGAEPIRFFMCGEYGEKYQRPHFHACLFGFDFSDKVHARGKGEFECFRSDRADELWGKGDCLLGSVTFESAAYVARYSVVRIDESGQTALAESQRFHITEHGELLELRPEFNRMSLSKGGIGGRWCERFAATDVFPDGCVVVGGRKQKAPRSYDRYQESVDAEGFLRVKELRKRRALSAPSGERTARRRAVKATVARAALALKSRS